MHYKKVFPFKFSYSLDHSETKECLDEVLLNTSDHSEIKESLHAIFLEKHRRKTFKLENLFRAKCFNGSKSSIEIHIISSLKFIYKKKK